MRVMKVPVHEVVDMVPVGHGGVAAPGRVDVSCLVARARVGGRATRRVRGIHGDRTLVHVIAVHGVQVAIMDVVDVIAVLQREVAAVGSMDVGMVRMSRVRGHGESFGWCVTSTNDEVIWEGARAVKRESRDATPAARAARTNRSHIVANALAAVAIPTAIEDTPMAMRSPVISHGLRTCCNQPPAAPETAAMPAIEPRPNRLM